MKKNCAGALLKYTEFMMHCTLPVNDCRQASLAKVLLSTNPQHMCSMKPGVVLVTHPLNFCKGSAFAGCFLCNVTF